MRRLTRIISTILAASFAVSGLTMVSTATVSADSAYTLSGTAHVQDVGDCAGIWDESSGTLTLGTRGQGRRVEAITIDLENNTGLSGTLQYRVHVQNYGWQDYRSAGEKAGTSGQALRLEGIEMYLTGQLSTAYSVEYRVHIQDYGDAQGWVSDGALAGTTGESKRLEEVQIRLVPKYSGSSTTVNYRVHRQDYGWESVWKSDGQSSGTTGESKRLEGIEIHLSGNEYPGGIQYKTHVQNIGWESKWSQNGEMSGTQGMSYRLEAIQIELTGEIADEYDVYYRVHAQDYGWLGWAKNGEVSGTSGLAKRLEAIQIVLVRKGGAEPGNTGGISSVTGAIAVNPEGYVYPAADNGSPAGSNDVTPAPTSQPSASPTPTPAAYSSNTVEHSYEELAVCDGISFAISKSYLPYWNKTYYDKSEGITCYPEPNVYMSVEYGIYVSDDVDVSAVYIKHNGDEGYLYTGGWIQFIPDPYAPMVEARAHYYPDSGSVYYMSSYFNDRQALMSANGYNGMILIEIACYYGGVQDFDIYYKDTKLTTLTVDCGETVGTMASPFDVIMPMYNDVIQYKDNMNDLELMSAGCYWIRNHAYADYSCWGCHTVGTMMMMRGYTAIALACSKIVDGQIINDYNNYYSLRAKNAQGIGHHIALVFVAPGKYAFIECSGSTDLAKGQTDFSTPWYPSEVKVYSIYDKVSWLRDYDTIYDMMIGDYGIDISALDPYDCSTWYN